MEGVVGEVKDPEADNENTNGTGARGEGVTHEITDVRREADKDNSHDNKHGTKDNKGATPPKPTLALIA